MYSDHVNKDRAERIALVDRIGWGDRLTSIVVNRGRKEGREILILTNNAIIEVRNERTLRLVTVLIARPKQLEQFFPDEPVPEWLLWTARLHQRLGYNKI